MPRSVFAASAAILLLGLTSCGRGHAPTAASPDLDPATAQAPAQASAYEYIPARFHVQVDPGLGSATVTPVRDAAASPQAKSFDLDIANFTNVESFKVTGVQVLNADELQITFTHAHPFPSIIFTNPTTSTNRADLGYTGRLVILADGSAQSFFGGEVTLDPSLVVRPDGYVNTGDLLATTTLSNDTFPYVMLADELKDNRIGIPSGTRFPRGNFDTNPVNGGWNAANIVGPTENNGWTGFDFVHQGQTIENSFILDLNTLASSTFDFDVALLIKYTDPRGTTGKTNRRPLAVPDNLKFCYRLPFAALDCSVITVGPTAPEVSSTLGDTLHLAVGVRDYDAQVEESGDADLSDEPDQLKIPPGTGEFAMVEVDVPDFGISPVTIAPHWDSAMVDSSNLPNNLPYRDFATRYRGSVANENGSLATGSYLGCIRVTDPEDASIDRPMYHFGVDPVTLAGDPSRALALRTYQPFEYNVTAPTGSGWGRLVTAADYAAGQPSFSGFLAGSQFPTRARIDPVTGDIVVVGYLNGFVDFDPGNAVASNANGSVYEPGYIARYSPSGNLLWVRPFGSGSVGGQPLLVYDLAVDASGASYLCGRVTGISDINPGPGVLMSPGTGDDDAYVLKLDAAGSFVWGFCLSTPTADAANNLILTPANTLVVSLTSTFGTLDVDPGPGVVNSVGSTSIVGYSTSGAYVWGGNTAFVSSNVHVVAMTSAGTRVDVAGYFSSLVDLDPTAGTAMRVANGTRDAFMTRLDLTGNYLGDFPFGSSGTGAIGSVTGLASTAGTTYVLSTSYAAGGGTFDLDPTFGTDLQPANAELLWALSSAGVYQWGRPLVSKSGAISTGNPFQRWSALDIDGTGQLLATISFDVQSTTGGAGGLDCDPGAGIQTLDPLTTGVVHRITSAGALTYVRVWYGPAPSALAAGSAGQAYLAGAFATNRFPDEGPGTPAPTLGPNGEFPLGDGDNYPMNPYAPGFLLKLQSDGNW